MTVGLMLVGLQDAQHRLMYFFAFVSALFYYMLSFDARNVFFRTKRLNLFRKSALKRPKGRRI